MRLEFVLSAINININKYIYFFNYSLFTDNNIMNKIKLYLRQNDLGSKTCYYFPAYLGERCALSNHLFCTIELTGTGKKFLSGVLVVEL